MALRDAISLIRGLSSIASSLRRIESHLARLVAIQEQSHVAFEATPGPDSSWVGYTSDTAEALLEARRAEYRSRTGITLEDGDIPGPTGKDGNEWKSV